MANNLKEHYIQSDIWRTNAKVECGSRSFLDDCLDASHYIEAGPANSCPKTTNTSELPPVDELLQSTQSFGDFNGTEPVLAEETTWLGPVIATSTTQPNLNQPAFVILPSDSSISGFVQTDPNLLVTDEPADLVPDLAGGSVPVGNHFAQSSAPFIFGQTVYELQSGDIFVLPQGTTLGQMEDYSPRIFCGEAVGYVDAQNLPQLQVFESDLSNLDLRGDYETIESVNFGPPGGEQLARFDPVCEAGILNGANSSNFAQTEPAPDEQTQVQSFVQENTMLSLPTVVPTGPIMPTLSQKDALNLSQSVPTYHVMQQDIPVPTELPSAAFFGCLQCSSQFFSASELQIHASTHSIATNVAVCTVCYAAQPRPPKDGFCSVCGQNGFQEAQNSYTLFNSAADGCRFYCAHCSQTFLDIASLELHIAHLSSEEPGKVLTQACMQVETGRNEDTTLIDQPSLLPSSHPHLQQQQASEMTDARTNNLRGSDRTKNVLQLSEEQIQKLMQLEPTRTNSLSERFLIEAANRRFTASYPKPSPIQTATSRGSNAGEKDKRSVVCTLCSHHFRRSSDLRRHMFLHSGVRPYGCDFCSRRFIIQGRMLQHMIKAHGEEGSARAAQYSFSRRRYLQRLARLQRTFTTPQKFTCHVCGAICRTLTGLRGHVRAHTNTNIYACPHCNRSFRSSMQRKRHLRVCSTSRTASHPAEAVLVPPQQQVLPVLEQDPSGMGNSQLAVDVTTNLVDLDQQHVYPECESHFDLANYFLEVNESESKVKPASWLSLAERVGEKMDAGQAYRPVGFTDLLMTDSPDPQGFECIDLNEAVAETASHSRAQVESSANTPPARRRQRVPHVPHNDGDRTREGAGTCDQSRDSLDALCVPWWQCKQCKESFSSGRLFLCHPCVCGKQDIFPRLRTLQRATALPWRGGGSSSSDDRSVQCVDCAKTFPTRAELRRHARTHSQERPFVCATCGATFSQACSLDRHERTHNREEGRIYRCRFCSSRFVQKCNMFRHMTKEHGFTRLASTKKKTSKK
ncbi:hypothetical protein SprV_0401483500 [Sparganum proliferum]